MAQDMLRHVQLPPNASELERLLVLGVKVRLCHVCRKPLYRGERKVHRVACAHKRELQLQKMRRQSRRS
jgi:hypothetical protein